MYRSPSDPAYDSTHDDDKRAYELTCAAEAALDQWTDPVELMKEMQVIVNWRSARKKIIGE